MSTHRTQAGNGGSNPPPPKQPGHQGNYPPMSNLTTYGDHTMTEQQTTPTPPTKYTAATPDQFRQKQLDLMNQRLPREGWTRIKQDDRRSTWTKDDAGIFLPEFIGSDFDELMDGAAMVADEHQPPRPPNIIPMPGIHAPTYNQYHNPRVIVGDIVQAYESINTVTQVSSDGWAYISEHGDTPIKNLILIRRAPRQTWPIEPEATS